jgi:hypothetical protein
MIYRPIKTRGTHLSFIVPYKFEELIYNLSFYKTREPHLSFNELIKFDGRINDK